MRYEERQDSIALVPTLLGQGDSNLHVKTEVNVRDDRLVVRGYPNPDASLCD